MSEQIVYVACAEAHEIHILGFDPETGALTPRGVTTVSGVAPGGMSMPLALSPDRRVLYAGVRTEPFTVASFAIDPATGALAHIGNAPLPESMCSIAVDTAGTNLLAASYGGAVLSVSRIGADGAVDGPAVQVMATPPKAHSIIPDPTGRFVYAASLGGDVILYLALDAATGRLTPAGPAAATPPGAGPRHLRIAPDGRHLYAIGELAATIEVFARDAASGALSHVQTVAMLPPGGTGPFAAADIHLTPDGRFLYGSERKSDLLAAYAVAADGRLTPLGTVASEDEPRGFAIDPTGRFLLCAGQHSDHVGVYAIGADGLPRPHGRVKVGRTPNWVEILAPTKS